MIKLANIISEIRLIPKQITKEQVLALIYELDPEADFRFPPEDEPVGRLIWSEKWKIASKGATTLDRILNNLSPENLIILYNELKSLKKVNEIKLGENATPDMIENLIQKQWKNRTADLDEMMKILIENGADESTPVREFLLSLDQKLLNKIYYKLKSINKINESPQDYAAYLDNPDFKKDYNGEQQIQKIIITIKDRINNKKWTEYSDGSYTMKIGDLYIKYFPEGSNGLRIATLKLGYKPEAGFSPDSKILYLYGKVNDNEIRHELTHYIDSKTIGGKQMASQSKERNNQLAQAQGDDRYKLYYNTPEEFNAHWFEYIMPIINQIFEDGKIPSQQEFTNFIHANNDIKNFYNYLNEQNKQKFNKRLNIYYKAIEYGKPEIENGKIQTPGFIAKLKSLFIKKVA